MDGACGKHGREGKSYRVLVEKHKGKRQLGRLGVRKKIILNGSYIGLEDGDQISEAQDRIHWLADVNTVMNSWVLYNERHFLAG
jgi:hypothetical protein